jgi:hypothetical protein
MPSPATVSTLRGPSDTLRTHWASDQGAEFAFYADIAGLVHTPIGQSVLPAVAASMGSLEPDPLQCIKDAMASVQEVLILGRTPLILIGFDERAASPNACLAALSATPTHVEGVASAYRFGDKIIARQPGFLAIGNEAEIVKAVRQTAPQPTPAALTLADDQYVAWRLSTPDGSDVKSATGRIIISAQRLRFDIDADVSEQAANEIETQWQSVQSATAFAGVGPAEVPTIQSLLRAMSVERKGNHISAAIDIQEPVAHQLRDLSAAPPRMVSRPRSSRAVT